MKIQQKNDGKDIVDLWKIIDWLSGKKTTIAAMAGPIIAWVFAKGWIEQSDMVMIASVLSGWTGVALFDKGRKALKGNK